MQLYECSYNNKITFFFIIKRTYYGSTCFLLEWKYDIHFLQHKMLNMLILTPNLDGFVIGKHNIREVKGNLEEKSHTATKLGLNLPKGWGGVDIVYLL